MSPEQAEMVALKALGWLASHEELAPTFMGASGVSAEDMRVRAADPVFLASILEFVTLDDAWVTAFCDENGLKYSDPLNARYALPGAEQISWT